jgi:hypothetical protein
MVGNTDISTRFHETSGLPVSTWQWWEFYRDDSLAVFTVRILSRYTCAVFLYAWVRAAADPNAELLGDSDVFNRMVVYIYGCRVYLPACVAGWGKREDSG